MINNLDEVDGTSHLKGDMATLTRACGPNSSACKTSVRWPEIVNSVGFGLNDSDVGTGITVNADFSATKP